MESEMASLAVHEEILTIRLQPHYTKIAVV